MYMVINVMNYTQKVKSVLIKHLEALKYNLVLYLNTYITHKHVSSFHMQFYLLCHYRIQSSRINAVLKVHLN